MKPRSISLLTFFLGFVVTFLALGKAEGTTCLSDKASHIHEGEFLLRSATAGSYHETSWSFVCDDVDGNSRKQLGV